MPELTSKADWLPDPAGRHQHRYWDGSHWTRHVSDSGKQSVDPPVHSPPSDGAAAWLPDPSGRHEHRYWNGKSWTKNVSDKGVPSEDSPDLSVPVAHSAASPTQRPATLTGASATAPQDANRSEQGAVPDAASVNSSVRDTDDAVEPISARTPSNSKLWPMLTPVWCRACGNIADSNYADCANCNWPLTVPQPPSSNLGMVYELKGKLGLKVQAICVGEEGGTLTLYASAKQSEEVETASASVSKHARPSMSSAGRTYAAISDARGGRFRVKWDLDMLGELAWTWANRSTADLRALADEALELQWHELYTSLPLSPHERNWRAAHEASAQGDLASLRAHLRELPPGGYPHRCGLLAPHFATIIAEDGGAWNELLRSWDPALPGVVTTRTLLDSSDADLEELSSAQHELLAGVPDADQPRWLAAIQSVPSDVLPPAPHSPAIEWETYRWYLDGQASSGRLEPGRLGTAMLDDLIEDGRITSPDGLEALTNEQRWYFTARTAPLGLDHDQLLAVSHHSEIARRCFIARDMTGLHGLPSSPDVEHYTALAQFVEGGAPADSLRPDSRAIIDLLADSRAAIESGETRQVPDELAADPTTWVTFRELALAGEIESSPEQRLRFPRFGNWIDLNRVLHLIWTSNWTEADELARRVEATINDEVMQDEVLSLRAFALHQLGRPADALSCLESAMAGSYTEALLVNTGIIARDADPALATKYFTRLINEAPTIALQVSAMRSAVHIWSETPDLKLPPETSTALLRLLGGELDAPAYLDFIRIGSRWDAEHLTAQPPPRPKVEPNATMHDFFMTKAGLFAGENSLPDVADKLIAVLPRAKGSEWFDAEVNEFTKAVWDLLVVDFGDGTGASLAAERLIRDGQSLLTRGQYFFFALQSGAHQAAHFRKSLDRLNDEARQVFFFRPVEEFRVERKDFPSGLVDMLEANIALCLRVFLANDYDAAKGLSHAVADEYNALVQRLAWDSQNRYSIKKRMAEILELDQRMINGLRQIEERCAQFPGDEKSQSLLANIAEELSNWQNEVVRLRARL